MKKHQAIFKLYPNVINIVGDEGFDANGNLILFNDIEVQKEIERNLYKEQRASEYPPITDYLDGVVKGDQAQIDAYIAACQAVKAKYPKPESV
jgi:methyl coenzyme M reductase subunit C-like uncharacterized protein (methanogenesis marker protein 7)